MYPKPVSQEFIRYPFTESSTLRINDTLFFPTDFISDAHLYAYKKEIYEITGILKTRNSIKFIIGTVYDKELMTGEYQFAESEDVVNLFDMYGRRAGVLMVQSPESLLFFPNGEFRLNTGTARFEVSCHLLLANKSVEGFRAGGRLLSGDVQFVGTQGVILVREGNVITVHFTGEPYFRLWERARRSEGYTTRYVTSVRLTVQNRAQPEHSASVVLLPDENGNIPIYVGSTDSEHRDALRIIGQQQMLEIKLAK